MPATATMLPTNEIIPAMRPMSYAYEIGIVIKYTDKHSDSLVPYERETPDHLF